MEQTDIKLFRLKNKLKQQDLAAYLQISPAFISQIENGSRKAPKEMLNKIAENKAWDSSMLESGPQIIAGNNNGGDSVVTINGRGGTGKGLQDLSTRVAVLEKENEMLRAMLEKENEMLRAMLKDKDAQIELLRELLKK